MMTKEDLNLIPKGYVCTFCKKLHYINMEHELGYYNSPSRRLELECPDEDKMAIFKRMNQPKEIIDVYKKRGCPKSKMSVYFNDTYMYYKITSLCINSKCFIITDEMIKKNHLEGKPGVFQPFNELHVEGKIRIEYASGGNRDYQKSFYIPITKRDIFYGRSKNKCDDCIRKGFNDCCSVENKFHTNIQLGILFNYQEYNALHGYSSK